MAYVGHLEAVSANGAWSETFYLFDQENGGAIDLSGWKFRMGFCCDGYQGNWWSTPYQASSDAGSIVYIGNGAFVVTYSLRHGLYRIVLEMKRISDGFVLPILTGTLALQRGLGTWQ